MAGTRRSASPGRRRGPSNRGHPRRRACGIFHPIRLLKDTRDGTDLRDRQRLRAGEDRGAASPRGWHCRAAQGSRRAWGEGLAHRPTHCTEADISQQHFEMAKEMDLETVGFLMMAHMRTAKELVEQAKLME